MPRDKDLKRLVRARMKKTGEAYTAARAQITKPSGETPPPSTKPAKPSRSATTAKAAGAVDLARIAGKSDAAVKERTGCTWERWTRALDRDGAATMSHREIASLVHTKYEIGSWWAQTVAVGYERIKGLRAQGQLRNGTHQFTKSRTYAVPVAALFDAWFNPATRRRWLAAGQVRVRKATAPKSMRLDWADGGIVAVGFLAKGAGKSSVALEHAKLPDRETAERLRQFWSERLDALGDVVISESLDTGETNR